MINENLIFQPSGGIDTDSNARAVAKGDYRAFEYCRLGQVSGEGFTVINSLGTREVNNPSLNSGDKIIGAGVWQKESSIVYLVYRQSADDEIWVYDVLLETHTLACESPDLNFFPDYPFFHFDIIEDLAKFTGGKWDASQYDPTTGNLLYNPPMQINVRKTLDGDYPTVDLQVLDAVKWPPKPPVAVYGTDTTHVDNKLRRKLFRFRVQYIYENSEETVWSLWSNLALPTESEFVSGNNWPNSQADNKIDLTFNTGANVVKKINIAVQIRDDNAGGAETSFGVFEQIDKAADGISDNVDYVYSFYGNVSLKPIDPIISGKNYDRLPIYAYCSSLIENTRIAYTNFVEGYDKTELDVTASYVLNEIDWKPKSLGVQITAQATNNLPIGPDWLNYILLEPNANPIAVGDFYSYVVTIYKDYDQNTPVTVQLSYLITQEIYDQIILEVDPVDALMQLMANDFAASINDVSGSVTVVPFPPLTGPNPYSYWMISDGIHTPTPVLWVALFQLVSMFNNRQTLSTPSLKVGATHPLGIVYGDRAFRDSTVLTNEGMNLFVPWYSDIDTSAFDDPNNPFTVSPKLSINNLPPIWAEYYWIVWRKATEISDFSQWVINSAVQSGTSGTAIVANGQNRFEIFLDRYYTDNYQGASINHVPQKGDVARFVRQRLPESSPIDPSAYVPTYFELEVMAFEPSGGAGLRPKIIVEVFDRTLLDPSVWTGQTIEIYTPRPTLDVEGTLFVAEWRDGSEAFEIGDPHTENRYHKGSLSEFINVDMEGEQDDGKVATSTNIGPAIDPDGVRTVVLVNNDNETQEFTISSIEYNDELELWLLYVDGLFAYDFTAANGGRFRIQQDQVVVDGVSVIAATLNLDFGDVYVRQRNYASGYSSTTDCGDNAYYFIEDPHYSDYWLSDIHQFGRFEIESPYAKQIERIATSIHSDVYFPQSQINGLSSFGLDNSNVMDMNPQFGKVVRTFLSGREEKTLKCIQEKKENSIYIQHYPDQVETPTGNLRVSDKTFASWYPYKGIFGCSDAGASILYPDGTTYYFDRINGVFIHSSEAGQVVISERDPSTGRDFKFRKKTKEITKRLNENPYSYIRSYVDITQQEVGFCFAFSSDGTTYEYEIVTFDILNGRWRTYYYYNFDWFCNYGQTLVGWGANSQLYVHNDPDSLTFHGETFECLLSPVSNDNPLFVKRYQNITQRANKTFEVSAYAEPNQSYSQMATEMPSTWFDVYEGYSKGSYRRNIFDPTYATSELALLNGEEVRAHSLTHELTYNPQVTGEGFILFSLEISYLIS